ncbi:MAG: hypothetical protein L6Q38_13410 [Nitrospira sp.]|nr:hypothetical protein [Nitrospira sp.]
MHSEKANEPPDPRHDNAAFATTHWSIVVAAGDSTQADSQAALAQLCRVYWYPVYVFIRRKGVAGEDARDLTQSFFEDFLKRNQIQVADRAKGRFRSFLLTSVENFLHNQWRRQSAEKRGGGQPPISLDAERAEERFAAEPMDCFAPDVAFDHKWAHIVLEQAASALEAEWTDQRRSDLFRELMAHLWSDPSSIPYSDLCHRFDLTAVNLRVTFHRFRQRYRELLRQVVRATVAEPSDVDAELQTLVQAIRR